MRTSSRAAAIALSGFLTACVPANTAPARAPAPAPVRAAAPIRPPVTVTRAPVTPTKTAPPARTTAPRPAPVAASPVPAAGQNWQITGVVPRGPQVSRTFKITRLEQGNRTSSTAFSTTVGDLLLASNNRLLLLSDLNTNPGKNVLWCAAFWDGKSHWGVLVTERRKAEEAFAALYLHHLRDGLDTLNSHRDLVAALDLKRDRNYGTCTISRR